MSVHTCPPQSLTAPPPATLPDWVPSGVHVYLSHVASGQSLRALARDLGCHASTIMRQVRRLENRRDDPLVDGALRKLDECLRDPSEEPPARASLEDEARHYLIALSAPDTLLIVAPDMAKAVITREGADGVPERVAVLDRELAEAMALLDWITCRAPGRAQGRVLSYVISPAGRLALRGVEGLAPEAPRAPSGRIRYGATESPVSVLARRRDKTGAQFLSAAHVQAAERMREDFVMADLGDRPLMTVAELHAILKADGPCLPSAEAARMRLLAVFADLGMGLGDVALRCCCQLEGVEATEIALGWSARSGKIVLRIALERMRCFYRAQSAKDMMIG